MGLGILSSVGLGTGLHTFILYLGPYIASITIAAFDCESVDFPEPPYPLESDPALCLLIVYLTLLINPRHACTARVIVLGLSFRPSFLLSFRLSVCYHVFSLYAQQDGQKAIPTGSVPHWLYFKNVVFESYGVKSKSRS